MPRVVHFEIHCDEPERAVKFYQNVFGWKIDKWEGPQEYWLISTGDKSEPGIDGGLMKRMEPAGSVYNTVQVPSVDDYVRKVTEGGGEIVMPKHAIPGVGYLAYCKDTEGNIFGIMHSDMTAK